MKITKLRLIIALITFGCGVSGVYLWMANSAAPPSFVVKLKEVEPFSTDDSVSRIEKPVQQIEKKTAVSQKDFSIIEGDYGSQQYKSFWMYLYSMEDQENRADEEKFVVGGRLSFGSKTYTISEDSYFSPETGELSFTTERLGRVFYKFSGKVFQKDYNNRETVLEGTVEKIRNSKTVFTGKHQFRFFYHGCGQ